MYIQSLKVGRLNQSPPQKLPARGVDNEVEKSVITKPTSQGKFEGATLVPDGEARASGPARSADEVGLVNAMASRWETPAQTWKGYRRQPGTRDSPPEDGGGLGPPPGLPKAPFSVKPPPASASSGFVSLLIPSKPKAPPPELREDARIRFDFRVAAMAEAQAAATLGLRPSMLKPSPPPGLRGTPAATAATQLGSIHETLRSSPGLAPAGPDLPQSPGLEAQPPTPDAAPAVRIPKTIPGPPPPQRTPPRGPSSPPRGRSPPAAKSTAPPVAVRCPAQTPVPIVFGPYSVNLHSPQSAKALPAWTRPTSSRDVPAAESAAEPAPAGSEPQISRARTSASPATSARSDGYERYEYELWKDQWWWREKDGSTGWRQFWGNWPK